MSTRVSILISLVERYSILIVGLISTVILSRLLTPEEIGVFSVGASALAIVHALRDFGVSNYIIQERDLTQDRLRSALLVSIVVAWFVGFIVIISAPWLGKFYGNRGLEEVFYVMALGFFIMPFSSTIFAVLKRDMSFKNLYVINTLSAAVQALISVVLAYSGYGYMSMAWGGLSGVVATFILALLYKNEDISLMPGVRDIRKVLSFSGLSSLSSIMAEVSASAPDLIMGKSLGFHSVGQFSRASGLVSMFDKLVVSAVGNVAVPVFAKKSREDQDLKDSYLKSVYYLTAVAWPFFMFILFDADFIVNFLFGDQWKESVAVVQILCIGLMLRSLGQFSGSLLIAAGAIGDVAKHSMIIHPVKIILIGLAVFYGLNAVASAVAFSSLLGLLLGYWYVYKVIIISIKEWARIVVSSLCLSVIPIAFGHLMEFGASYYLSDKLVLFITKGLFCVLFWVLILSLTKHPMKEELQRMIVTIRGYRG